MSRLFDIIQSMSSKIIEKHPAKLIFFVGFCGVYFYSMYDSFDFHYLLMGNPVYLLITTIVAFHFEYQFNNVGNISVQKKLSQLIIIGIIYYITTYLLALLILGLWGLSQLR